MKDAQNRILSLVCDTNARSPQALGQVAIRYFKFLMRGFVGDSMSDERLLAHFVPCISALTVTDRIGYVKRQVLGKIPAEKHGDALEDLEKVMRDKNCSELWEQYFAPLFRPGAKQDGVRNA